MAIDDRGHVLVRQPVLGLGPEELVERPHPIMPGQVAGACGEIDGHCYMAMEFIQGPSLMELVKEHGVLPEPYALHVRGPLAERWELELEHVDPVEEVCPEAVGAHQGLEILVSSADQPEKIGRAHV